MQKGKIYEERILLKWTTSMLAIFTIIFLFLMLYQIVMEPVVTHPALHWFFLLMILLFLVVTINFNRLIIRISSQFISVGYGLIKYTIPWENVNKCYLDESSTITYGGWGIRLAKVKGKRRLAYIVLGESRIVLSLKRGRFNEFVFSTKSPEEVIKIVNKYIDRI